MAPDAGTFGRFRGPLPLHTVERHRRQSIPKPFERQHEPHQPPLHGEPSRACEPPASVRLPHRRELIDRFIPARAGNTFWEVDVQRQGEDAGRLAAMLFSG